MQKCSDCCEFHLSMGFYLLTCMYIDEAFEKTFTMSLDLFGISDGRVLKLFELPTRRSRRLNCPNSGDCEPITLLHLGFVDFPKYFVAISFDGLQSVHQRYHINNIHFYVSLERIHLFISRYIT